MIQLYAYALRGQMRNIIKTMGLLVGVVVGGGRGIGDTDCSVRCDCTPVHTIARIRPHKSINYTNSRM